MSSKLGTNKSMRKTVAYRMPPEVLKKLKLASDASGITQTELVVRSIDAQLSKLVAEARYQMEKSNEEFQKFVD